MAIHSMTGYGQAVSEQDGLRVSVEIRSVNHRFAEFQVRVAKEYAGLDDAIRQTLAKNIARGRCDVYISIEAKDAIPPRVTVNWGLLSELVRIEREAHARGFELAAVNWLTEMEVLTVESGSVSFEDVRNPVLVTLAQACDNLVAMRAREGQRLLLDLYTKLSALTEIVTKLKHEALLFGDKARARLLDKLNDLELSVPADRLLTEVALLVERSSVEEELVRLQSHVEEFQRSLDSGSPIGRRLDFVVQEMHREVNTIAAKAADHQISQLIVDAKTLIEQLREQVQNIE
jgi:uncharacterized protein (TIGR00255 family)